MMLVLCLVLVGSAQRAGADESDFVTVQGGIRYRLIGTYDVERLNKIVTAELKDFETTPSDVSFPAPQNGVKLYRVIYPTVIPERNNQPTEASGLIAAPDTNARVFPLLSYQHGTVFSKNEVPSFPEQSMETRLLIANFAGNGYVVIGADYIGKGISTAPDTYMVKESTIQACMDMLSASKLVLADLGLETKGLFLSGWSQGSWSTMMFRNRLETFGIPVTAAATACTPSAPYVLMTRWINKQTPLDVSWIVGTVTLLINSYEYYYDLPELSRAAIKPDYVQTAQDFYANKIGWTEAAKVFPATTKEFLKDDFATASSFAANRFYGQLMENEAYQWRYTTPSRYYYGLADECIAPYVAQLPVAFQETVGGASATAVFAGDQANHRGTFVFGVRDQKAWFDELLSK
ncbi:MAG TPA: hypothetical protein DCZ95_17710 [Verrucomicrobia bacterium]|nr:hypothetical protein [Verrucomicrobiota bacterium]